MLVTGVVVRRSLVALVTNLAKERGELRSGKRFREDIRGLFFARDVRDRDAFLANQLVEVSVAHVDVLRSRSWVVRDGHCDGSCVVNT